MARGSASQPAFDARSFAYWLSVPCFGDIIRIEQIVPAVTVPQTSPSALPAPELLAPHSSRLASADSLLSDYLETVALSWFAAYRGA